MRRPSLLVGVFVVVAVSSACARSAPTEILGSRWRFTQRIDLPAPDTRGSMSLEEAIRQRRSGREFRPQALPTDLLGQLLWAGQGITDPEGKRSAPSAGALYPLELYVVTAGQFMHYLPEGHRVETRTEPDRRAELEAAALGQASVGSAPAVIVVAAVPGRTRAKYGSLAEAFVNREAGHATQNILLEATARGLAAVPVGSFNPADVQRILALPPDHEVLYLVPVGFPGVSSG